MANTTPPKLPSGFSGFTQDKRVEGGINFVKSSMARSDIWMAVSIVFMLVILILPMPAWLLDTCLALSITMSVLVMMTSIFIEKPTQFTSFPLVLLITTMYRLALNLASTRLILGQGHLGKGSAGNVIEAFGSFVMGGNFVIGVIVFAILVLVNFMVITKGSGRIAEVAARFTLDAMAGKQMAIDADLSSGIIDEKEAIKRREELSQENSFYGAMDGASKFVRGDAIAGLIITAINVIAGMIIGMAQNNLSFSEASDTYIRLTVGDGLVSQIPALIISMAAGIMVSKAGMTKATDQVVLGQLTHYPKAMGMSAALGGIMAFLPGIPALPFLFFATICGGTAYFLDKQKNIAKKELEEREKQEKTIKPPPVSEEPIANALKIDLIRLELGYGLITLINDTGNRRLTDQIKALRRALAIENGFVMPSVRIQDNMQLPANMYIVYVKEVESGRGEVRPHQLLVMDPRGDEITLPGEKTREPTFGLPAAWIDPINREEAMFRGYTVVDAPTVITTHITEIVKSYMAELLSYTETQKLLDELKEQQKLVKELLDGKITVGGVQRVLQNLLQERVSIRDLPTILEGISEALAVTRSTMMITEHVRYRLARHICSANADIDGVIKLVVMSPEWEQIFAESLVGQGDEKQLAIPPIKVQQFVNKVRQVFEDLAAKGEAPVLMTTPTIRPYVRSIVDRFRPLTVVLSQNEIHPRFKIRTMGQI
ncbi:MAG: Flagellar biosynthesis protein FlhA [Alphaproteobacteria bacterium ADurb.Bin438]|nr:MAG: Flagellar biosynthesis protein FlhA [Alphaproteobacteria bacterium ADurb.Bin438]